jgi:hypothetical protein
MLHVRPKIVHCSANQFAPGIHGHKGCTCHSRQCSRNNVVASWRSARLYSTRLQLAGLLANHDVHPCHCSTILCLSCSLCSAGSQSLSSMAWAVSRLSPPQPPQPWLEAFLQALQEDAGLVRGALLLLACRLPISHCCLDCICCCKVACQ